MNWLKKLWFKISHYPPSHGKSSVQERRIYWHKFLEKDSKFIIPDGRAWLNICHRGINIEWGFFHWGSFSIGIDMLGEETDLMFHIKIPALFYFYLSFEHFLKWKGRIWQWLDKKGMDQHGRSIGFRIMDKSIWIDLFRDDSGWAKKYKGLWIVLHPIDRLLGKMQHSKEILESNIPVQVPMPEGIYNGVVQLTRDIWKRPRWPFKTVTYYSEIKVPGGVPFPGKGENSYDCGEDAIMSTSAKGQRASDAVSNMVKSVLRNREKNGGKDWRPNKKQ